jgi:pyruvate dehydrogenase E1 component beta subunit
MIESVCRTHRVVVVDEGWRSGSISAEISARIVESAFFELDAAPVRVCTAEVPLPYPRHLEQAALPTEERVEAAVRTVLADAVAT